MKLCKNIKDDFWTFIYFLEMGEFARGILDGDDASEMLVGRSGNESLNSPFVDDFLRDHSGNSKCFDIITVGLICFLMDGHQISYGLLKFLFGRKTTKELSR